MTSQIEQVKEAIDIVALIGERVKLNRSGKNFRGLCPFHSEKSPSFFVTPELGRYKCFGCGESGDAFTFLQKLEGMTFAESLRELAKRAGITLESIPLTTTDKRNDRLREVLSLAKEFYHYLLTTHPIAQAARDYLHDRGTTLDTIKLFGLGFAPDSWDSLSKYLIGKKGFSQEELVDAGVAIRSQRGSYYDRFRGRVMFPLTTHRGQVVGFSGRLLEKNIKEAKYINTPETALYHKSELLFGYSQLQRFIRDEEEVIVCEGEFDVLSSLQAHVGNVVAIKGSALTQAQLKILSFSAKRIILALDADSAGIEATKRAITLVRESGLDVRLRVLPLVGGKDPDDLARSSPGVWRELSKKHVSVYEYLIDIAFRSVDPNSGDGKAEITTELRPLLIAIDNAVEQAHYIQEVAKRLGVSEETFARELRKVSKPVVANKQSLSMHAEEAKPRSRDEVLQRYVLTVLFSSEPRVFASRYEALVRTHAFDGVFLRLLEAAAPFASYFDPSQYANALPSELSEYFAVLYMEASDISENSQTQEDFFQAIEELSALQVKNRRKNIATKISALELSDKLTKEQEDELATLRSQMAQLH